jgi:ATP-dependent DNA helicase RecG
LLRYAGYDAPMRHPLLFHLFTPVSRVKGAGPSASEALMRLLPAATQRAGGGLPIIRDLLFHLPVGIIDRTQTYKLREAPDGVVGTFVVKIHDHVPPKNARYSKAPYKVVCGNESGEITLVFFHARPDYISKSLPIGAQRVISGKLEKFDFTLQMTHPDIIAPVEQLSDVQKPEAVYPLTAGMTSRKISKLVEEALAKMPELPEWQADAEISFKNALSELHHPENAAGLLPNHPARLRLVYDEILAHQLELALLRRKMQQQTGTLIQGDGSLTGPFIASLPYKLTGGQKQVLFEISNDLSSGRRMVRLLQGDVGSGKTIVAFLSMLKAVEQGLQSAFMAPTELIARQHYNVIRSLWPSDAVVLLTGSVKGKARDEVLSKIKNGEAKIIIGTHALFQEHVLFHNLSLVVIDEQHRFGVAQRMALTQKGETPHILHMTATPIPRSLTMMLYGDMDCSLLKEKPENRKQIATRLIPKSRYAEVVERLGAALERGEKAYWICPLIEDTNNVTGDADIAAAQLRFTEFKKRFGDKVGLLHGRMKAEDREREMQQFMHGKTELLVATTVVEVGVDVKDATITVIEQAERFGLSQLHQLRGRVGRSDRESACVYLYTDTLAGVNERLSILRETEDGFRIAEADLAIRGGGELLGVRQSGVMGTVVMDMWEHAKLIEKARDDAKAFLIADPDMTSERGKALQILLQLFERDHEN